jgi:hypothetical protein
MTEDVDRPESGDDSRSEVDPAQLRRQLSEIKTAMGLEERYPGQRRLWLVYGTGVGVASVLTEVAFVLVQRGPGWFYQSVWLAFTLVTGFALWQLASRTPRGPSSEAAPDWRSVFGTLLLATLSVTTLSAPMFEHLEPVLPTREYGLLTGAYFYGLVIAVAGVGFLFVGSVLRTYRIRRRDRWVFYAAGIWMLAFAAAFTQAEFMQVFGYALFGILFFLYSIVAYVALGRSPNESDGSN